MNKGHIPRDKTLRRIAEKLDLDATALTISAHQERMPADVNKYFLAPAKSQYSEGKRTYPLSQEQCDYLSKILKPEEIQLVRKTRQVTSETKTQINGYIDYVFTTSRQKPPELA